MSAGFLHRSHELWGCTAHLPVAASEALAVDSMVAANVRQSCKAIAQDDSFFSGGLKSLAAELDKQLPIVFGKGRASGMPIFFRTGDCIECEQQDFFGFYLLREAIRGCLSSVNFQIAGEVLLGRDFFAPAVALFYTSAFHSIGSYLALNRRVLLNMETFNWYSASNSPATIAACLTRNNTWVFEERRRSHVKRWKELAFVFRSKEVTIPNHFRCLFRTLFPNAMKSSPDLLALFEDQSKYRAEPEDYLEEFLRRIPEIRNRGLYHASGEDPYVQEVLVHGIPCPGLNGLAAELGSFGHCLLGDVTEAVCVLLRQIALSPNKTFALMGGVGYPFRDELRMDLWGKANEIKARIQFIEDWLQNGAKREDEG